MEYPAVVEFAPFQGLAKSRSRKNDVKRNTVETDPDFITFLETLNSKPAARPEGKMEYSYRIKIGKLMCGCADIVHLKYRL